MIMEEDEGAEDRYIRRQLVAHWPYSTHPPATCQIQIQIQTHTQIQILFTNVIQMHIHKYTNIYLNSVTCERAASSLSCIQLLIMKITIYAKAVQVGV